MEARQGNKAEDMIDNRTRIDCIHDGSWNSLSDWEKTQALIEFSEGKYENKHFGSIEAFICWYHRERLNPEDHFADIGKMVCDSPSPEYKKNQGDSEKLLSAKCAICDFPKKGKNQRLYCMCGH